MREGKGRQKGSSFGGHWAGTGMESPTSQQFDDHKIKRDGAKSPSRQVTLSTDKFKKTEDFFRYCEEQSSEVKVYHVNDLEKAPE